MSDSLEVYLGTARVGRLRLDAGRRFVFAYDERWLRSGFPLSLHLPLRSDPYNDEARPFFSNLLPEGKPRQILALRLGLSEQNDFAPLEAVGGECAGAVTLLPEGTPPGAGGDYRRLSAAALDALVDELPTRPMLVGERGVRLSLAGAQDKLPVLFDGHQVSVPLGGAPSSHILKPPIERYPHTVENEWFCMQLAGRLGLSVPTAMMLRGDRPLYLVERYDRRRAPDGQIERIHQEDFCQALGVPPDEKYEREGGPGLARCLALLRDRSIQPVRDTPALLEWVVFNYLIGNADAHAKNVSLLLTEAGPMLAPFYDLMCTAVYPDLTDRMAMRIGDEDRPQWVIAQRWQQFAEEVRIGYKLVHRTLVRLKDAAAQEANGLARDFRRQYGDCEIVDKIVGVIEQRKRKITNDLAAA